LNTQLAFFAQISCIEYSKGIQGHFRFAHTVIIEGKHRKFEHKAGLFGPDTLNRIFARNEGTHVGFACIWGGHG